MSMSALTEDVIEERLGTSVGPLSEQWGGQRDRQPVHTVYGGADLFAPRTVEKLGDIALRALDVYAPTSSQLALAVGHEGGQAFELVYERVRRKLSDEPIEDYRIDFEDGYGHRSDREEDEHARQAGASVAEAGKLGTLPPFVGVRVKSFNLALYKRSHRTLALFLEALLENGGRVPSGFVVTLPKVETREQVEVFADVLGELETRFGVREDSLKLELMIETPRAVIGADGHVAVRPLVESGGGRVRGVHFGTYDYTALLGITAEGQSHSHPACDLARGLIQVSLGQTGVFLSDGATNILPAPIHRDVEDDSSRHSVNVEAVHRGWRVHFEHVQRSLSMGYFQGWDLHPNHLVTRYAAVYEFFLRTSDEAGKRLRGFLDAAARASVAGGVFDDAATGHGLLNFFLTGLNCGALDSADVNELTGVPAEKLIGRSFASLVEGE